MKQINQIYVNGQFIVPHGTGIVDLIDPVNNEKGKNASDIYLDPGFEDLSHFSFTFRKQFGITAKELGSGKKSGSVN